MKRATTTTIIFITALVFWSAAQAADRQIVRRQGTAATADPEAKTALVIGNGDYKASPLRNPVNDARAMARTLEALGFEVDKRENIGWREMSSAATGFGERLMKGGVGLFYYAGHGMQYQGRNYLIPVDSDIRHEKEIPYKAVDAGLVLAQMENARNRLNVVVLDACRDNPFARSFRSAKAGLAYTDAPVGTLIAYATSPGKTAADGSGSHGLYTAELIRNMQTPGLGILEMFMKVRKSVRQKSGGRQIPWESTSLEGNFYFKPEQAGDSGHGETMVADSGGAVVETPYQSPDQSPTQAAPKPKASLSITSNVSGSTVWINGQKMGGSPPLNYPNIRPGHYRVKVGKDGYETHEEKVTVEPGVAYEVKAYLEKIAQAPAPVPVAPEPEPAARNRFTNSLGMEFVRIPAGSFTMGSPENEPGRYDNEKQHRVTLSRDFFMQTTEVTQGQWKAVMGSNPSRFKSCGDDCPVEKVSWNDAQEFIEKLNRREGKSYRLPTEAEWEYAARAGTTTALPNGPIKILGTNNAPALDPIAWYGGNSGVDYEGGWDSSGWSEKQYNHSQAGTHPVGRKKPNAYGLHDMIGNVWEWCQDWYGDYPSGSVTDPAGPSSGPGRVLRGGGWGSSARYCRSANRLRYTADYRIAYDGFRLVLPAGR